MGQAGCPGREPPCLKPAGTWVGVSMYNDSNLLGDRRGSERRNAGTGEGISARIHVADSHGGDRAEEGRRSDRKQSTNLLWERDESCMSGRASITSESRSEGFNLNRSWKSIVIKKKLRCERIASVGVTPLNCTLGRYPNGSLATCKQGCLCAPKSDQTGQGTDCSEPSPELSPNPSDLGPGFRKASDGSRCSRRWQQVAAGGSKQAAVESKQGLLHSKVPDKLQKWREMRNVRLSLLWYLVARGRQ